MANIYDALKIVPWAAHALAGRLDAKARQRPAATDADGLLADSWGIGGVAWPPTPIYGRGTYRCRVVVLRLPAETVRHMLPANLSLATADADGLHPLVLLFGQQSDVRANIWPLPGWTYDEAVAAVPDVQALDPARAYQGPFAYMPRLWLDKVAPVLAGVLGYGFAKTLAKVAVAEDRYSVHDEAGALLAEARFAPAGQGSAPQRFPGWAAVERLLDQPLLAEPLRGVEIGSVLSFRTHDIRRVAPLRASIVLAAGAVPGFAGGEFAAEGLDGLPAAFDMESHWRITPPMPRGCFRPAAPTHPAPAPPQGDIAWAKPRRRRIAVLGGGVGAMTAVWALTQDADWRDFYEITVYQTGWRLGGKGASGRNAAFGQRIEEHGLHIWAGFYENAFRMMRAVYGELGREQGTPLAGIEDAFKPHRSVTLADDANGGWDSFTMAIPRGPGMPGEGDALVPLNPLQYLPLIVDLIGLMADNAHPTVQAGLHDHKVRQTVWSRAAVRAAAAAGHKAERDGSVLDAARAVAGHAQHPGAHRPLQLRALLGFARAAQRATRDATHSAMGGTLAEQMFRHSIELGVATLIGLIADGLVFRGFAAADGEEWRDWLTRHGAPAEAVNSALVRATYDYVFGFAEGDTARPSLAAGTTTHGVLRLMLTYRGAFFWAMQAGMGDAIFAPLYCVLKQRGVRFEYFHRVRHLCLSDDGGEIAGIEIARQARPLDPNGYAPLVDVKGLDSWPSTPRYELLQNSDELQASGADLEHEDGPCAELATLRRGEHFDDVILGISLGALPEMCGALIAASPRWRLMVDKVKTVATLGVQLWLEPDLAGLGWRKGDTIATAYAEPLDTWADLNWLLPREAWAGPVQPKSVLYLCGTLADTAGSGDTAQEASIARDIAAAWLAQHAGAMWPAVSDAAGALQARHLFREGGGTADQRFAAQYFRANTRGSERYVQTVPGATTARLRPGESGFDNLWLAGDWVRSGMNAGCVEAGAMGGLAAAAALSGRSIDIVDGEDVPLAATLFEHAIDAVHGVALTDALVVAAALDCAAARALLPDGLELAPQPLAPEGQAPVLFILARHRHARPNIAPFGLNFRELLVLLPAVRPRRGGPALALPGPYAYVARRVTDSWLMLGLGRALYGEAGSFGRFAGETVGIGGQTVLTLAAQPQGARVRAAGARQFAELDWLLSRPLLGRAPRGGWRLSRPDWRLPQASVQGLTASLTVRPGLRLRQPAATWRLDSGDAAMLGCFRIWAETARSNPLLGLGGGTR